MRGLDYYTGTVFEVFDTHPDNNRSLFGGGRYDGLVGLFGVDPIATVGMAPGATMFQHFLEVHNLVPHLQSTTNVGMVVVGDVAREAQTVAEELRQEGVTVAVDITGRKFEKQARAIEKHQIPFLLVIGEQEVKQQLYTLKELATGKEQQLSLERIVATVKDYRHSDQSQDDELFSS